MNLHTIISIHLYQYEWYEPMRLLIIAVGDLLTTRLELGTLVLQIYTLKLYHSTRVASFRTIANISLWAICSLWTWNLVHPVLYFRARPLSLMIAHIAQGAPRLAYLLLCVCTRKSTQNSEIQVRFRLKVFIKRYTSQFSVGCLSRDT